MDPHLRVPQTPVKSWRRPPPRMPSPPVQNEREQSQPLTNHDKVAES
ncbi:hypothetical protein ACP70R_039095 [Stipagrostis hirtigluma subsp. patula]